MIFLSTYHPLIENKAGQRAAAQYAIPPFVDGSCRREPDLESKFPSISSLCHGKNFAPRLREGDIVVYMTRKGSYLGVAKRHWRLTAIVAVFKRFESHKEAAGWYSRNGLAIPSNCMVNGNHPLPVDKTVNILPLDKWDAGYHSRARKWGVFLACKPMFVELYAPHIITEEVMRQVFGKIRGTRNPPAISSDEFNKLKQACGLSQRL